MVVKSKRHYSFDNGSGGGGSKEKGNTREEGGSECVRNGDRLTATYPNFILALGCNCHMMVSLVFAFFMAFCRLE